MFGEVWGLAMDRIRHLNSNVDVRDCFLITARLSLLSLGCLTLGCSRTPAVHPAKAATANKAIFPTAAVIVGEVDADDCEPVLNNGELNMIDVKYSMPGKLALPLPADRPPKVFPGAIMIRLIRADRAGNEICEFETERAGGGFTPSENAGTATFRVNLERFREGRYEMRIEAEPEIYPKAKVPERVVMFSGKVRVVTVRK